MPDILHRLHSRVEIDAHSKVGHELLEQEGDSQLGRHLALLDNNDSKLVCHACAGSIELIGLRLATDR